MKADRWSKVESLFHAALERKPEERRDFLAQACGGDNELLDEVQSMLAYHQTSDGFSTAQAPVRLEANQSFGRYRVVRLLGSGGMGQVYLAHDAKLRREVALKILSESSGHGIDAEARFEREAIAASRLNHPNIVTVYEAGNAGAPYIATEYVDGSTLRQLLSAGSMPPAEIRRVGLQVASALQAAHDAGIVHRDIKPENIMIRKDGLVKVLDFGLAKLAPAVSEYQALSIPGLMVGTYLYMSPEQSLGEQVDFRTDLWSLGVVLAEMASGVNPFRAGATPSSPARYGVVQWTPPEGLPSSLALIIGRLLQTQPDDRYPSAAALIHDLQSSDVTLAVRRQSLWQIRPWIGATVVALLLILSAGIASLVLRKPAASRPFRPGALSEIPNTGEAHRIAISADGRYIAYVALRSGRQALHVVQASTNSKTIRIPPEEVEFAGITFSPNTDYIYYTLLTQEGEGTLFRVPIIGGHPEKLFVGIDSPVSFSPDGTQIAFVLSDFKKKISQLIVSNDQGDNPRVLASRDLSQIFSQEGSAWSPDGKVIAIPAEISSHQMGLFGVDVATGALSSLSATKWRNAGTIAWSGKSLLLLAGSNRSNRQIHHIPLAGGTSRELLPDTFQAFDYSRGTSQILALRHRRIARIRVSAPRSVSEFRPVSESGSFPSVTWSQPQRLLWSNREPGDIWAFDLAGQTLRNLTAHPNDDRDAATCGSGRYVVFTSRRSGFYKVWRMDADGRNPIQLTDGSQEEGGPACAPGGDHVYFGRQQENGFLAVWKVPLEGGTASPVIETADMSRHPKISSDGRLMLCVIQDADSEEKGPIAVFETVTGKLVFRLKNVPRNSTIRWGPADGEISFVGTSNEVSNIWARSVSSPASRQLTSFAQHQIFDFDWSPDYSQLALVQGEESHEIVLIHNQQED